MQVIPIALSIDHFIVLALICFLMLRIIFFIHELLKEIRKLSSDVRITGLEVKILREKLFSERPKDESSHHPHS